MSAHRENPALSRFRKSPFLQKVPRLLWATAWEHASASPVEVWLSSRFMVQVYSGPSVRLTVCRTELGSEGRWKDGISWSELQVLKRQVGFGDADAVELFPADRDLVDVANMRHLWVLPQPFPYAWRKERENASQT